MLSAIAAFVATVLVARYLGPERFGPYAVLIATLNVATSLASPALDTGMVRFASQARSTALSFAAYYLRLKAVLALLTVVAGLALAAPLHRLLLDSPGVEGPGPSAFAVVFASAAIMVMWSSVQAWRQAEQHFTPWAVQETATSFLRLGWVAMGVFIGLGERGLLAGYGVAAGVVALAGAASMPRGIWFAANPPRDARRDAFRFTQWVVMAGIATALSHRLDVFLLAWHAAPAATLGHYGAALNLVLVGELAAMTLFHVLLPKASALTGAGEWRLFLNRHQWHALALAALLLPLAPAGGLLAGILFGDGYAAAGPYFAALIVGMAFTIAGMPANAVLYAAGKSRAVALLEVVRLAAALLAGIAVIPAFGALGMACTVAAVRGVTAFLAHAAARRVIARATRAQSAG